MDERVTVVPADFYDELIASLDEPDVPNEALAEAAARRRARLAASAEDEFAEIDTTEEEFDRAMAEGVPVEMEER